MDRDAEGSFLLVPLLLLSPHHGLHLLGHREDLDLNVWVLLLQDGSLVEVYIYFCFQPQDLQLGPLLLTFQPMLDDLDTEALLVILGTSAAGSPLPHGVGRGVACQGVTCQGDGG